MKHRHSADGGCISRPAGDPVTIAEFDHQRTDTAIALFFASWLAGTAWRKIRELRGEHDALAVRVHTLEAGHHRHGAQPHPDDGPQRAEKWQVDDHLSDTPRGRAKVAGTAWDPTASLHPQQERQP
jgi:hypothetical protein